jgi:hypothetical protein
MKGGGPDVQRVEIATRTSAIRDAHPSKAGSSRRASRWRSSMGGKDHAWGLADGTEDAA